MCCGPCAPVGGPVAGPGRALEDMDMVSAPFSIFLVFFWRFGAASPPSSFSK